VQGKLAIVQSHGTPEGNLLRFLKLSAPNCSAAIPLKVDTKVFCVHPGKSLDGMGDSCRFSAVTRQELNKHSTTSETETDFTDHAR